MILQKFTRIWNIELYTKHSRKCIPGRNGHQLSHSEQSARLRVLNKLEKKSEIPDIQIEKEKGTAPFLLKQGILAYRNLHYHHSKLASHTELLVKNKTNKAWRRREHLQQLAARQGEMASSDRHRQQDSSAPETGGRRRRPPVLLHLHLQFSSLVHLIA
jgi:hypothetical protein